MFKLFAAAWLLMATGVSAQTRYSFHSQNYVGMVEGEQGTAFQFHTINGVQHGTWFAGLGTGLDYYYFRSIPLFLSVDKYLFHKPRSLFFSADGGLHFLWHRNTANRLNFYQANGQFRPSWYWAGGIGYRIDMGHTPDAFLLYLGYSYKQFDEKGPVYSICGIEPCSMETRDSYRYRLRRLSIKLGWQF